MTGTALRTDIPDRAAVPAALVGAVTISFSSIFFALADVTPITGAFFRMVYAAPVLAVLWWLQRHRDHRPTGDRIMAFIAGAVLAADVILWHEAIDLIGAGLATLIANSQVVVVPLVTWLVWRERPTNRALLAMPVVLVGLALITGLGRQDSFGTRPVLGVALGLGAALCYSGFLIGYRRANRTLAPPAATLLDVVLGAMVTSGVVGLALGEIDFAVSWPSHAWLMALGLMAQVAGWMFIGYAIPRLPAAHTSFAILLQPTLTLVWGRLVFGEDPSGLQLTGVVIVLGGIMTAIATRSRRS